MPEPKIPVATPPASATPAAPATPAATAPKIKPAAPAPNAANPRTPSIAPSKKRPVLSAKTALGLEESPADFIKTETKRMRGNLEQNTRITGLPDETPAPAPKPGEIKLPDLEAEKQTDDGAPSTEAPTLLPAKIKIGEKEYTAEELVAENARLAEEARRAAEARQAPAPEEPVAPAPRQLTKEEIAAQEAQIKEREAHFVATTAAALEAPLTEEEMDIILAGGKEAVGALTKIRQRDMATAILQARKGMADILNPIFEQIFTAIKPLEANHQSLQVYNIEQQFAAKHKDFNPHMATCRQVAGELAKRYPQQVAKMTPEQFIDEVARQSDVILANEHRRWFPNENGNWRKGTVAPAAPAASTPAAAPAAPAAPRAVRAPAPTSPTATGATGTAQPWHKSVAQSMRG